ncbi:MAG: histidine kinase, partial [Burkholderiaceae bacterium]
MANDPSSETKLDWTQWVCPGPRRVFSDAELARGGSQRWPVSVDFYVSSNILLLLLLNLHNLRKGWIAWVLLLGAAIVAAGLGGARLLWRRPSRRRLNLATVAMALCMIGLTPTLKLQPDRDLRQLLLVLIICLVMLVMTAWWFLTLIRAQQIEARLRELDEQARSLQLARRLATAQIQPHFLFNTLASIQHWVDTRDPRAGATLAAFTRYLRATLPMFERESLPLAEELQMVRSYLEVMQARLGERLRWQIDMAADVPQDLTLPPGALLTLVENAIVHGIEPSLRGGSIALRGRRDGARVLLEVEDDGGGPAVPPAPPGDGVGLANTRARLLQLHGEAAGLQLQAGPAGGAIA